MNSEWFIFKGTHHIGPFSATEIEVMYRRGEISRSILIWKEGEKSWEPLYKVGFFSKLFTADELKEIKEKLTDSPKVVVKVLDEDLPPALPAAPAQAAPVSNVPKAKKLPPSINNRSNSKEVTKPKIELMKEDDDVPPPLPLDVFEPNHDSRPDKELKIKRPIFNKKFEGTKKVDYSQMIFIVLGVLFLGIFAWYYTFQSKNEVHFKIKNLMPMYVEKLESTAQAISMQPKIAMALSLDGGTLYFATNLSKELDVSIKLTSIKNRILGMSGGTMNFRGKVLDNLGTFNRVFYSNGQFAPGEYDYEVKINEKHFINTYFPTFYKLGITRKLNKQYTLKGKELIYSGTHQTFEAKLKTYLEGQREKLLKPYAEKKERLMTIKSILNQMVVYYFEKLDHAKSGKDLVVFQSYVQKNISPILQNMVVSDSSILSETNIMIKNVAQFSLILNEQLKTAKKISKTDKEKFKIEISKKEKEIEAIIDQVISKNEAEIQSLTR